MAFSLVALIKLLMVSNKDSLSCSGRFCISSVRVVICLCRRVKQGGIIGELGDPT